MFLHVSFILFTGVTASSGVSASRGSAGMGGVSARGICLQRGLPLKGSASGVGVSLQRGLPHTNEGYMCRGQIAHFWVEPPGSNKAGGMHPTAMLFKYIF